jgi:hypothetical protein
MNSSLVFPLPAASVIELHHVTAHDISIKLHAPGQPALKNALRLPVRRKVTCRPLVPRIFHFLCALVTYVTQNAFCVVPVPQNRNFTLMNDFFSILFTHHTCLKYNSNFFTKGNLLHLLHTWHMKNNLYFWLVTNFCEYQTQTAIISRFL